MKIIKKNKKSKMPFKYFKKKIKHSILIYEIIFYKRKKFKLKNMKIKKIKRKRELDKIKIII